MASLAIRTPSSSPVSSTDSSTPKSTSTNDVGLSQSSENGVQVSRRALPPPNYPPTSKDWANYRSVFTQLYRVENKTLGKVMEIMRVQYGFRAT